VASKGGLGSENKEAKRDQYMGAARTVSSKKK